MFVLCDSGPRHCSRICFKFFDSRTKTLTWITATGTNSLRMMLFLLFEKVHKLNMEAFFRKHGSTSTTLTKLYRRSPDFHLSGITVLFSRLERTIGMITPSFCIIFSLKPILRSKRPQVYNNCRRKPLRLHEI